MQQIFQSVALGETPPHFQGKAGYDTRYLGPFPNGYLHGTPRKSANSSAFSGQGLKNVDFIQFLTFIHVFACFLNVGALLPCQTCGSCLRGEVLVITCSIQFLLQTCRPSDHLSSALPRDQISQVFLHRLPLLVDLHLQLPGHVCQQ